MSEAYTFQRRRIFRRRGSWSSRAGVTVFVLLGAIFGYLLPEILSSSSAGSASFGGQAYGQVSPAQATDIGAFECGPMDCAGGELQPPRSIALKPDGRCKITGSCVGSTVDLEAAYTTSR